MKRSSEYPAWEWHPRNLSEEEAAKPLLVVEQFFDYASLPQSREKLSHWLITTVTGNFPKELNLRERNNLVDYYEQIARVIESTHIIYALKEKRPKKMSYNGC